MNNKFCPNCGISNKGNTKCASAYDYMITCIDCGYRVGCTEIESPTKTLTEACKDFVKTPLTESQEFGSKSKKPRKKK